MWAGAGAPVGGRCDAVIVNVGTTVRHGMDTTQQLAQLLAPGAAAADRMFAFHRPGTLRELAQQEEPLRASLREMPEVLKQGLWPKQHTAIVNLERSFALAKPRALIQMATGSGKTFAAANVTYRLIKHANARRVCFLVDRTNLGSQTLKEFQQYHPVGERHTFDKLYNISFPRKNRFDPVNRVVVTTIQRLYSVLTGQRDLAEEDEEASNFEGPGAFNKPPVPVGYNPELPPEFFDVIIVDECHRSIYSVWGDVLKYFDAFVVGLTATRRSGPMDLETDFFCHDSPLRARCRTQIRLWSFQFRRGGVIMVLEWPGGGVGRTLSGKCRLRCKKT